MHNIEPFFNWRHIYTAETDLRSPFYGRTYNEFSFELHVYDYLIHPQWDEFGSATLYMKILFVDYEMQYAIIELIGEWNDAIENDVMELKRDVIDKLYSEGIYKYILIGENVLNFHSGDKDYYEEWFDETSENNGWIVLLNLPEQSQHDFKKRKLNYYVELMEFDNWRTLKPEFIFQKIDNQLMRRLA
jgi:hypothetical protein